MINKIDFALVISAQFCNPNGDPLNGNRPRQDYDGYGYITDVCLKHKIRNRFLDNGYNVLNVDDSRVADGNFSVAARVKSQPSLNSHIKAKSPDAFKSEACSIWLDVRTFGQVFAFKGNSIPVRGPVSIRAAKSLDIIDIIDIGITKGTNTSEDVGRKKDSSTMGHKFAIDHGAYVTYGSVFPQLAELTGFSGDDADVLKTSLATIFENDASADRPSGSMGSQLFWWEHDCPSGRSNSLHIHQSLHLKPKDLFPFYDYDVADPISGVRLTII